MGKQGSSSRQGDKVAAADKVQKQTSGGEKWGDKEAAADKVETAEADKLGDM